MQIRNFGADVHKTQRSAQEFWGQMLLQGTKD